MKASGWALLVILTTFGLRVEASGPQGVSKTKAEVAGIHINKAPYKEDKELAFGMEPAPGVRVDILVTSEEGGIIKLEEKKCKISKFADDKGTDLLAKKGGGKDDSFMSDGPIGSFPKVSKDSKACLLSVEGKVVPAPGAKALLLEGNLALVVGKGKEVVRQEKVYLRKGNSFKVGSVGFNIDAAGKPDFGDAPLQVTLSSKDGSKVAHVRFLDAAGKELETKPAGSSSMSFGGDTSSSWSFDFKEETKAVTVEVALWKQVATLDIPVKLSISVGF